MKNKKEIKKFFLYSIVSLILSISLSFLYIFFPKLPDSIDNRLRDNLFSIRGELPNVQDVFIIDIDEKSINKLGQWPWSRNKVSKIINNLTNADIGIIGLDIVFAEEDNSSPHKIFNEYNIKRDNIPNYDEEFANTIANSPTILGYQFLLDNSSQEKSSVPKIPAIFIEKNKKLGSEFLISAKGTILNTPILQNNSYSSGFFNNIPDDSGVVRSVPLVISYENMIYPSLSLEILRIITNTKKVNINYDAHGIKNISINNIEIPTDRHGRILVNYRGKERNFKYFSAIDIYNNNFDKDIFKGKIALVGTSAAGLLDLRATPFDSVFPGVEVHANVIDNVIQGDFISKASWADGANISIIFILSFIVMILITYTPFWVNPIISLVFLYSSFHLIYYILFTHGIVLNILFPILTIISAAILATLFDYFYEIKQEEAIKEKFASKVSKEVMNNLLKNMDSNEFQAMEKEVTVFFSDIRGFTKISEQMNNPKDLIKYLNQYMEPMSNIIVSHEGTIDKYIGDAIMAYWNAPLDINNHADKALNASLEQLKSLALLNKKLEEENKPLIKIGIGLNTGSAIVGEMGSIGRSDYTAIGDSINLGSRLESLCKYYGSNINISNYTKKSLKEKYIFRYLDLVTVKGKDKAVEIWQVYGSGEAQGELKIELEKYHGAIKLYKSNQFKEALKIFTEVNKSEHKSNKNIYDIYINRCEEFIKTPPINFDGIFIHQTKT